MQLSEWINEEDLLMYLGQGIISERKHPVYDLWVLNYTPKAVSIPPEEWTPTLRRCRGLVYEKSSGEIISMCMEKFWNYDDARAGELPKGIPSIYRKMDGSYLGLFFYHGEPIVYTRGSFESDQAKWAQEWINHHIVLEKASEYDRSLTYVFEVIIPEDRKVVYYDFSGLVFLTAIFPNGVDFGPKWIHLDVQRWLPWVRTVDEIPYEELSVLAAKDEKNEEGYVATWYQGGMAFRTKIKMATYCRLHRLYFQTTTDVIWELVKDNKNLDEYLEGSDDKLREWVQKTAGFIQRDYVYTDQITKRNFRLALDYVNTRHDLEASEKDRRKAFAFMATQHNNPQLLFLLYDAKFDKYKEALWEAVRPKNIRFSNVEDEE